MKRGGIEVEVKGRTREEGVRGENRMEGK